MKKIVNRERRVIRPNNLNDGDIIQRRIFNDIDGQGQVEFLIDEFMVVGLPENSQDEGYIDVTVRNVFGELEIKKFDNFKYSKVNIRRILHRD